MAVCHINPDDGLLKLQRRLLTFQHADRAEEQQPRRHAEAFRLSYLKHLEMKREASGTSAARAAGDVLPLAQSQAEQKTFSIQQDYENTYQQQTAIETTDT